MSVSICNISPPSAPPPLCSGCCWSAAVRLFISSFFYRHISSSGAVRVVFCCSPLSCCSSAILMRRPSVRPIFSSRVPQKISLRFHSLLFFSFFLWTGPMISPLYLTPEKKCAPRAFSSPRSLSGVRAPDVHLNTAVIGLIVPGQDLHFPFCRVLGGLVGRSSAPPIVCVNGKGTFSTGLVR